MNAMQTSARYDFVCARTGTAAAIAAERAYREAAQHLLSAVPPAAQRTGMQQLTVLAQSAMKPLKAAQEVSSSHDRI